MEMIGIDVHKKESQLCIITNEGEVIEQRIRMERGRFAEVVGKRGRAKVRLKKDGRAREIPWPAPRGPSLRWRPVPSNLPLRRRASLANFEREQKAETTSRSRQPTHPQRLTTQARS